MADLDQTCFTPHNHRCKRCDTIWHHDPAAIPNSVGAAAVAHTCPNCGKQEYNLDHSGPPQFCSNGVRCIKMDGSAEIVIPAATVPMTREERIDDELQNFMKMFFEF